MAVQFICLARVEGMPLNERINEQYIAEMFNRKVTIKVATFIEQETTKKATTAGRRAKKVWNRHSGKTYRYRNTGELGRAVRKVKYGKGYIVDDGTRANYSSGYHGMYWLVEKQGERDVKNILNASKKYTEALKM